MCAAESRCTSEAMGNLIVMAEPRQLKHPPLPHLPQRRTRAWVVSVALHVAALGVLLLFMPRRTFSPVPEPERMVFVEPAPPPPPPLGGMASAPAAPVVPEPVLEQPRRVPQPQRLVVPRKKTEPAPTPAQAAAVPQGNPQGSVGGVIDGLVGGEAGGQVGGAVGGHGDAPIPADKVEHPPVVVARVLPDYPPADRQRGLEGRVVLRAVVDRQGRVEEAITVVDSVPSLDAAAVAALRRWRFQPGRDRDEKPVRVLIDVPMRFQLR